MQKTLANGNHHEGCDDRLDHIPGDENQEPDDEDRGERNGLLKDEIQIEVKIGKAKEVNHSLSQHKSREHFRQGQIFGIFQDLSDDESARNEPQEEPKGGLQHVGGASSLGKNGQPHETEDQVEQLAQGSPPASQDETREHHHQGLQRKRDVGKGNFDKRPNGRQGCEKGDQDCIGSLLHLFCPPIHLIDTILRCQIARWRDSDIRDWTQASDARGRIFAGD